MRTITQVEHAGGSSIISLSQPLANGHFAGKEEQAAGKSLHMRARVGLLSRNVVIRGNGQGEDTSYHLWNIANQGTSATAACGNGLCDTGENSESCSLDCIGPAYEFGASILVGQ